MLGPWSPNRICVWMFSLENPGFSISKEWVVLSLENLTVEGALEKDAWCGNGLRFAVGRLPRKWL